MPPAFDPSKSKVDGLAFLGLSLTRKSDVGHPESGTHQTAFDLNEVLDRDYKYVFSTSDDGWLVGGGEPGPPTSHKLAAKDSAHVEILRIGTYRADWGGLPVEEVVDALHTGKILIPQIEVVPTAVVANGDLPPEVEIRFDVEPSTVSMEDPLPTNWQLRFLHNQLFRYFQFPSRFCPGAFHSTILRKAEFRSLEHRAEYFKMCDKAVKGWKKDGVKPLTPPSIDSSITQVKSGTGEASNELQSGLWLFTDRNNITHFFEPNFLPPYDTPEKKHFILDLLKEEWDEKTLSWKPVGSSCGQTLERDDQLPVAKQNVPVKVEKALANEEEKKEEAYESPVKLVEDHSIVPRQNCGTCITCDLRAIMETLTDLGN